MVEPTPTKTRIVDNPHVPELYANRLVGATFDGGSIAITMGSLRLTPEFLGDHRPDGMAPCMSPRG